MKKIIIAILLLPLVFLNLNIYAVSVPELNYNPELEIEHMEKYHSNNFKLQINIKDIILLLLVVNTIVFCLLLKKNNCGYYYKICKTITFTLALLSLILSFFVIDDGHYGAVKFVVILLANIEILLGLFPRKNTTRAALSSIPFVLCMILLAIVLASPSHSLDGDVSHELFHKLENLYLYLTIGIIPEIVAQICLLPTYLYNKKVRC